MRICVICVICGLLSACCLLPSAFAAIANVSNFCAATNKASSSTMTITPTAQLDAGNIGVLVVASDNIGTTDGDLDDHTSVTDSVSNTWNQAREFTNGQGAAAAGVTVSVWWTKATTNLPVTGSITVNFASAVTAKAAVCREFTIGAGNTLQVETGGDLADDGVDAGLITLSGLNNIEHLLVRGTGAESPATTYTASTNYTAFATATTSGGAAASNIGARGEYRIATLTSDSTDPVASGAVDHASTMVSLKEITPSPGGGPRRQFTARSFGAAPR